MDRAHKDSLAERIRSLPAAMVATHDTEFAAAFADRVVLLGEGEVIADGTPEDVLGGGWHFSTDVARATDGAALLPSDGAALLTEELAR
jgi:energy-coupling factor transport system ATP-binding protein